MQNIPKKLHINSQNLYVGRKCESFFLLFDRLDQVVLRIICPNFDVSCSVFNKIQVFEGQKCTHAVMCICFVNSLMHTAIPNREVQGFTGVHCMKTGFSL